MKNQETLMICARFNKTKQKMENFLLPLDKVWMLNDGEFKVGETDVYYETSDLTDDEMRRKAIETLKAKQKSIMAVAQQEKETLEAQIQELLCLTYQPDETIVTQAAPPAPVPPLRETDDMFDFDDDIPF